MNEVIIIRFVSVLYGLRIMGMLSQYLDGVGISQFRADFQSRRIDFIVFKGLSSRIRDAYLRFKQIDMSYSYLLYDHIMSRLNLLTFQSLFTTAIDAMNILCYLYTTK